MFSINQILKMQVDETGEATDTFVNPMAGMSIVAQDLANLYGESSVSEPLNAEPVRRPDVIDEDELSDESWAKQIQPKLELEEQTNTCSQCGLTFKNRQSLRRHKSTHSDFKPFRCDQCDYSTTLKEYLRKHMKFRHKMELTNELSRPNKRLPIPTTSQLSKAGPKFDYTVSEPTIDSVPRGANTSSQYKCEECSYSTDKYNFLRKHSYSHLGYQTYSCDVCDFVTTKNRYLVNHMKKHLESSAATADAGSSTSSAISFVSDVFSVSNPEQETQIQILKTATLLPKKSKIKKNKNDTRTSKVAASWIVNVDATGKRSFKCRQCEYVCVQTKNMKQHERKHSGKKLQCQYCDYDTLYKKCLVSHINQHMTAFEFKCHLCLVGFIHGSDLLDHITKNHPNLGNFCKVCKVYFQTVKDFDSHLSIHSKTCRVELRKLSLKEIADSKATFPIKSNNSIVLKDSTKFKKLSNIKTYIVKNGEVSKLEAALTKVLPEKISTIEKFESANFNSSVVTKTTPLNAEFNTTLGKKNRVKEPFVRIRKLEEVLLKPSLPVTKTTINPLLDKTTEGNKPISCDDVTELVVLPSKTTPVSKPIPASPSKTEAKSITITSSISDPSKSTAVSKPIPASPSKTAAKSITITSTISEPSKSTVVSKPISDSPSKTAEKSVTITPSISDPSNELIEDDLYLIVEEEDVPQCSAEVIEEIDISDSDTDENVKRNQTTQPIVISLPLQTVNVQSAIPTNCAPTNSVPKQSFPSISAVTGNFPFYSCSLCPFSSQSELSLRHHSWNQHSLNLQQIPKRLIKCDFCPQSFERRCDVLRHQQSHLGVKNFKCVYCNQMFARRDGLLRHTNNCSGVQFLNNSTPTYVVH